jgi:hypothetical protein
MTRTDGEWDALVATLGRWEGKRHGPAPSDWRGLGARGLSPNAPTNLATSLLASRSLDPAATARAVGLSPLHRPSSRLDSAPRTPGQEDQS